MLSDALDRFDAEKIRIVFDFRVNAAAAAFGHVDAKIEFRSSGLERNRLDGQLFEFEQWRAFRKILKYDAAQSIARIIARDICFLENSAQRDIFMRKDLQCCFTDLREQFAKARARVDRAGNRQ